MTPLGAMDIQNQPGTVRVQPFPVGSLTVAPGFYRKERIVLDENVDLRNAGDFADRAKRSLGIANKTATAVESIIILDLIKSAADLENRIAAFVSARMTDETETA